MLRRALRTTRGRLALLLGAVGAVVLASAALLHFGFDEFDTFGDSLWSATKHVLDPSSLQDDEGAPQRVIGLFQVITGLVLLVGLLFTVIAETVSRSIERLGRYEVPVRAEGHLVAIGGIDLAPETEIYSAGLSRGVVPFAIRAEDGTVTIAPREEAEPGPGDELLILDPELSGP